MGLGGFGGAGPEGPPTLLEGAGQARPLIRRAVVCRPDVGVCFNLSIYLSNRVCTPYSIHIFLRCLVGRRLPWAAPSPEASRVGRGRIRRE